MLGKQPPELFCVKGVLRNFTKFTGKHLCQSLFFKKETLVQLFSCEFCETSKNTFFTEHLWTTSGKIVNNLVQQRSTKNSSVRNFLSYFIYNFVTRLLILITFMKSACTLSQLFFPNNN